MYRLFPVYSRAWRWLVAGVGLSESPAIRPMRGHVVRLIRWSHVPHVGGVVSRMPRWVLAWIIHGRSVPGVVRRWGRSCRRRTVEPRRHIWGWAPIVNIGSRMRSTRMRSRVGGGRVVAVIVCVGWSVPLGLHTCWSLWGFSVSTLRLLTLLTHCLLNDISGPNLTKQYQVLT